MTFFNEILPIMNSLLIVFAMAFSIYRVFKVPDEKAELQLGINKATCEEKHRRIDEILLEFRNEVSSINKTFSLFRQNDFHHIEENTKEIGMRMAKMEGQNEVLISLFKDFLNKQK